MQITFHILYFFVCVCLYLALATPWNTVRQVAGSLRVGWGAGKPRLLYQTPDPDQAVGLDSGLGDSHNTARTR